MTTPRVLLIGLAFGRQGGIESYNMNMASALMAIGCEVDIWSVLDLDQSGKVGFSSVCLSPKNHFAKRVYYRIWKPYLRWRLSRGYQQYTLIIAGHLSVLPIISSVCRQTTTSPVVWACTHGTEAWAAWSPSLHRALASVSAILTVSRYSEETIRIRLPDCAIHRVYNAVDTDYFRPITKRESSANIASLLTVGRLTSETAYKGQDVVINALPQIMRSVNGPIEYRIVGTGDAISHLQDLAVKRGVAEHVKFLGRLSDAELLTAYQACDLFIMPSRVEQRSDGSQAGEGFGIVYLEASACGKPVVGSNQGGAKEAVLDGITGFLVSPDSVQNVANAVSTLLTTPELAQRMGQAGREFVVENFSMSVFHHRVSELFHECFSQKCLNFRKSTRF